MQIGSAFRDITPSRPLPLQGQMHERIPTHTRDPLTANAIAFADGGTRVVLVSCDLCILPDEFVRPLQEQCERRHGISARNVLIAATHTHLGPCMVSYNIWAQKIDAEYRAWLDEQIVDLVGRALTDLEELPLHAGKGWLEHMGWNRMGLHHGGAKSDMYYGSWKADFAGVAGPRDGDVPVIFARRADGTVKAVVTGFASHPNCCEGDTYFSADLAGAARVLVRQHLGANVGFVYLTGAAGDTAPTIMVNNPRNVQPWRGELGLQRSGAYLGAEIVKTIAAAVDPMPDQTLRIAQETQRLGYRPWPADLDPAQFGSEGMRRYFRAAHDAWPALTRDTPPAEVRLNVLRLGTAALCTNPAEFYCHHGLSIKDSSPAALTMVAELTDGYCGYVPTAQQFPLGGYSTWPSMSSKLSHDAGDQMVAATKRLLARAML